MLFYNKKKLIPERIQMSFGELLAVRLCEHGRGRKQIVLPVKFPAEPGVPLDLEELSIGQSSTGRPTIIKNKDNKLFLIINTYGGYTRRGNGWIRPIEGDFKILAEGNGADGDAGRIGTWGVYVIEAPQNGILRIRYSGQYRGGVDPEYNDLLFVKEGKVELIELKDIETYLDSKGLPFPSYLRYNDEGDIEFV